MPPPRYPPPDPATPPPPLPTDTGSTMIPDVPAPPPGLGGVTIDKAALNKQAATQVAGELKSQIDPIQALVDQYATQQGRAVVDINNLYGDAAAGTGLFGASTQSAERVKASYDNLLGGENAVFAEASARLSDLRAQRGADAQALAQQIGAPVPASTFTNPVDLETRLSIPEFAGAKLQSLGLAAGGVQQAEAYAGQVMPMMKARQVQETRNHFQDLIAEEKKQIASLKGQKAGLVSQRQRELLTQEREYKLNKLSADRDWWMARQQAQARVDELNTSTRNVDANNAANAAQAAANNAAAAAANATDNATRIRLAKIAAQAATKAAALRKKATHSGDLATSQNNALAVAEGLLTPGVKSVKVSVAVIDPLTNQPTGKYQTITQQIQAVPTIDPNELMDKILTSAGVNKNVKQNKWFVNWLAEQLRVRARTSHDPNVLAWSDPAYWGGYGQRPKVTFEQMMSMSADTLDQYARRYYGFKGNYPKNVLAQAGHLGGPRDWLAKWIDAKQNPPAKPKPKYGRH